MVNVSRYQRGLPSWREFKEILYRAGIWIGDLSMISFSYFLAYFIRFHSPIVLDIFPIVKGYPPLADYVRASPVILMMWTFALSWVGTYKRINLAALDEAIRVFRVAFLGTILAMSAMFLYRESSFSRLVFLIGGILSGVLIYLFREFIKVSYITWIRQNRKPRRVLILGKGYLVQLLQKVLERQRDRAVLHMAGKSMDPIRRTITRSRIREVLMANPEIDHNDVVLLASYCEERGVVFRLLPDILAIRMGEVLIDDSLGVPTFQLKPVSLHGSSFMVKRLADVFLATMFIGIFFIPLFLIAVLIKLSSTGPVFYSQKRMGYQGRSFDFMKFRTMCQDADKQIEQLKAKSDRGGPVFKMKNDPRVTLIGRFLRRFSIDEIPQLLNVLRGEMSLVGPRPQVIWETLEYNDWTKKRLNVLPGITGLWQVSGRAELTFDEMIELDIYYIEHWSPGLDVKIILKTLPAIVSGKGAY